MNTLAFSQKKFSVRLLTALSAVVVAVALPQLFHAIGIVSGLEASLGTAFLPMHIPVLLAGLFAGPALGLAVGALSPVLSFAISGMPVAALLPLMMLELAAYGVAAGLLGKTKMPVVVKVLLAQLGGRLVRAAAIIFAIYALGSDSFALNQTWSVLLSGLPGILLQLAVIPLIVHRVEGLKKNND